MRRSGKTLARIGGTGILLLLILAAAALPGVFLSTIYGYLPVLVLCVLLLLSWGGLLTLRRGISVQTGEEEVQCQRGGSVELRLRITNRSRLICPRAEAVVTISSLYGQADTRQRIAFALGSLETVPLAFQLDMSHVGIYAVGLEQITLFDFFGIVRKTFFPPSRLQALVTPKVRDLIQLDVTSEQMAESNADTRVTVVGGTDYTGVREYALGDPMKQIHWKLSAHTREYVTKLQESSRQQEFAVVLDFSAEACGDAEALMELNDCLIETAMTLLESISRLDAVYGLVYADRGKGIQRAVPAGTDAWPELLRSFAFVMPEPTEGFPDGCQLLQQEGRTDRKSVV